MKIEVSFKEITNTLEGSTYWAKSIKILTIQSNSDNTSHVDIADTAVANQNNINTALSFVSGATDINFYDKNKLEYHLPSEGTVVMWLLVKEGNNYDNFKLRGGEAISATIYTTTGPDAWWPGSTWFTCSNNGDLDLSISIAKGNNPCQRLHASNTSFRYNEWHKVGFSYGRKGQSIFLDGEIVASNPNNTKLLEYMNDCNRSVFGYFKSCVWGICQFDCGFTGKIKILKISNTQHDY